MELSPNHAHIFMSAWGSRTITLGVDKFRQITLERVTKEGNSPVVKKF